MHFSLVKLLDYNHASSTSSTSNASCLTGITASTTTTIILTSQSAQLWSSSGTAAA